MCFLLLSFDQEWGATFKHPAGEIKGHRCGGGENQGLYRGLVYIAFRCSPLRRAIFERRGGVTLADKFVLTVDWVRWLAMPASNGFTRLVNYFVIVWAFLEMWNAKGLPKDPLALDDVENDPPLFSALASLCI
ncbi:hypothetical protein BDP27DRAFT_1367247 [Rhodocollybia butyracea]|uniref:Uncharacterized protein n=1 Tax=Rhodocollybia butyracea TaxID=206335 RepID=A0A9P5U2Z8_9AGAR|nr:hypothetical protein BDP27DRAFT_1367247 [Rhodocollybia butyracea]